jgi:phosphoribosylglycinamide formyltransferase-1
MNIAVFASGKGSNAENICHYFHNHSFIRVSLIVTDRKSAGVLDVAHRNKIPSIYINKDEWKHPDELVELLVREKIDLIVLAGFLKLIPQEIISTFNRRIINIHPALLPAYGGQGMYGHHVHEAVHKAGEKETGVTIHYVDQHYDTGDIIFQAKTSLHPGDGPEEIAARIHQLEMKNYPKVIESLLEKRVDYKE